LNYRADRKKSFGALDVFIIVFFLLIAALGFEMFRRDLLQTFSLQNEEPVGTIIVKRNIVQRRLTDRVVWDRLSSQSPVYAGDIIRVADVSTATLNIGDNSLDISENTLIRITRAADGENVQVQLSEGSLSVAAGENSKNIILEMNGQKIQTDKGTVLSAVVSDKGQSVQVSSGKAQYVSSSGVVREIEEGGLISVDSDGRQRLERAAVFTQPLPSARYVKTSASALSVNFVWNRINLESNLRLRMEIARDSAFVNITRTINNLDRNTQAQFDAGVWYYRLVYQNEILSTGQLTITDTGLQLVSPAFNSIFRYTDEIPVIKFQWTAAEESLSYVFEISNSAGFESTQIRNQLMSVYHSVSDLPQGLWYWRVRPVFPDFYNNNDVFSAPSIFRVEQAANTTAISDNASVSSWLAEETPSNVLPPSVPRDIVPVSFLQPLSAALFSTEESKQTPAAAQSIASSARTAPARENRVTSPVSRVTPPSLLQAPRILQPPSGGILGHEDLSGRSVTFRWSGVQGANSYVFTLFQITQGSRRQIIRETINGSTVYTLNNLRLLSRGNFLWQVEPLNIRGSTIEQRGNIGESTFIIDIPSPGAVQIEDTGILYGN